ncbi:MAG: endonuclease/exonuclease/phosphatase family protein [Desulfofustis sp.]|nr:endonuclease/exonuclease/phosphatase family protein [Desulfofustis sp.]
MQTMKTMRGQLFLVLTLAAIGALSILLSDGFAVPDHAYVLSGGQGKVSIRSSGSCGGDGTAFAEQAVGIDPAGFSVFSWNTHKGDDPEWQRDLVSLGNDADIVLLQEAALGENLRAQLSLMDLDWQLAPAFHSAAGETGVMSISPVRPHDYCALRETEPIIRIPKMALTSTYPLHGTSEVLLVVNVHVVNFTLALDSVRSQIDEIKEMIRSHRGPVVVAGDFNTWSEARLELIDSAMAALDLQPVAFHPDHRSRFFNRTVDAVYCRGLEVVSARSYPVQSSDHNPLSVHFRISNG